MSNNSDTRTRGVFGTRIPADSLRPVVQRILAAQFDCPLDSIEVTVEPTLLLMSSAAGWAEYSTLIDEGVRGARLDSTNTVEVYVVDGFTYVTVPVGIPVLKRLAEDGEEVDLADFVRVFGDRLERNLSMAQRWVREGTKQ